MSTRDSGTISSLTGAVLRDRPGAFLDPVAQQLVALGTAAQPQPSLVGDLAERLGEQQAALGSHDVDAAAARLAAEGQKILVGQVAPQAEAKAPFACRCAVASTRVASCLAEGWNHVAAEAHGRWLVHLLDLDDRA